MDIREDSAGLIEIPIFPLPGVVLFPGTQLPLHIFEPGYLRMLADALAGSRRIGMVLARPGAGEREICELGVVGHISGVWEAEDGNYDVVLSGMDRFRIVRFTRDEPYRQAQVQLVDEVYESREDDGEFAAELIRVLGRLLDAEDFPESALMQADFPTVVNWMCAVLQIRPEDKQTLLELDHVRQRAEAAYAVARRLLSQKEFVESFAHLKPQDPRLN